MVAKPRKTQEQRSTEMRNRILEATVTCLVEDGYQGTTISKVTQRARTSRGAHQHHFSVKSELVINAVEYLAQERIEEVRRLSMDLPDDGSVSPSEALDLIWHSFSDRLYLAATELWHQARIDDKLRQALIPAERRMGAALRSLFRDLFKADQGEAFEHRLDLSMDAMRGLAMRRILLGERVTEETWQTYRPLIADLLTP